MKAFKMAVGTKIFAGFIALVCVGAAIGAAGYLSLNRVTDAGDVNQASRDVRAKLLEARILEKDYLIKKDNNSFAKLSQSLGELASLTAGLQARMGANASAGNIAEAQRVYKQAMDEIKRLEEDDANTLAELQRTGEDVARHAEEDAAKAVAATKQEILQGNEKTLKEYSRNEIGDVISVGYDVLKFYHDRGMPREAALDAVRNLHFAGANYFFVVQQDLILVAHGSDRGLEGKDFGRIQDKKTGKYFMKEVVEDAVRTGESFTEYFWNKPGMGDAVFPKLTYAKYFKPWDLVICSGVYVDDIEKQVAKTGETIEAGLNKLQRANDIKALMLGARLHAVYYLALGKFADKVAQDLSQLKALASDDALEKKADAYQEKFNRTIANSGARQKVTAQIGTAAANTIGIAETIEKTSTAAFADNASSGKQFIIGFILAGAVLGFAFAILLTRTIVRPIKRAIGGIEEASGQVATASGQVSGASRQLAEGASEQAASIEETSSSLEEMASMTKQNSEHANQANHLMAETGRVVSRANASMAELTSSMTEISRASEETSKIIKTIDEIAFQTNLLALNAAVEAARAGEAGAGFAVVADEVRNLAMRAADAAKNTASLIEGTVTKIREGSEIVEKTSAEFTQVAAGTRKVGELIGEIAAASNEQSQGIEQINKAVTEMDKVVQQNAANAEESASASEEMNAQAEQMKDFVGEIKVLVDGSETRKNGTVRSETVESPGMRAADFTVHAISAEGIGKPAVKTNGKDISHHAKHVMPPEQLIPRGESEASKF